MTELSPLPSIRVRLPFQDRREFLTRFAPVIAAKGFRIPTSKLRPVGSEIRLVLELRNGEVVSGDAVVEAHVQVGGGPALSVRYRRLHEGSIVFPFTDRTTPAASAPARIPEPMRTDPQRVMATRPAPATTPRPQAPIPAPRAPDSERSPVLAETSASVSAPVPARTPAVPSMRAPVAVPPAPTPARTGTPPAPRTNTAPAPAQPPELEANTNSPSAPASSPGLDAVIFGRASRESSIRAGADAPGREVAAEDPNRVALEPLDPTREPAPSDPVASSSPAGAAERTAAGRPWWRRQGIQIAGAVILLAFMAAGAVPAIRVASRRLGAASAPAAAPSDGGTATSAARVDLEVAAADKSISHGELSGGADSALAHLVTARGIEPKNSRVQPRLRLLADTLVRLGTHALARGDSDEAAVHLAAADEADPGRAAVREGLQRLRSRSPATEDHGDNDAAVDGAKPTAEPPAEPPEKPSANPTGEGIGKAPSEELADGDVARVATALATISASCARASGTVEVKRGGDTDWRPLSLAGVLRPGDVVRTGAASSARVAFLARGAVDLEENATVEVGVTAPTPESKDTPDGAKETTVSVESGVVRGFLPPRGESREVGLVIRGADGSNARLVAPGRAPAAFRVTRAAKRTELAITKGEVEVRGGRSRKKIRKGRAVDVAAEGLGEAHELLGFPASIEPGIDARFQWAGDLSIRLAWKPVPKATGYRVQIAPDLSFQTVKRTIDVEGTQATFSPPSVGTFAWRVASRDRAGRYGEYGFARRIYCERDVPRDLLVGPLDRAVMKSSDHAPLAFTWQSAASAHVYRLVVATGPDLLEHKVVSRATSGQRLEVKGLAAGEYYWGVFVDEGAQPEPIFLKPRALVVQRTSR